MEISKTSESSVKIKGKSASVVIDPASKIDSEIVIALKTLSAIDLSKVGNLRLVVSGPGEYEAGGISITGKAVKKGILYYILESVKILLTTSDAVSDVPDDEEFDCLLINVQSQIKEDAWGPVNTKCVVLYGDLTLLTVESEAQEKVTKVNLKKTAEIQGKVFLLG